MMRDPRTSQRTALLLTCRHHVRSGGVGLRGGTMDEPYLHQQEEGRYARDLAEKINARALEGQLDALVVVAPARTMGELRPLWHKEVAARIIGEHVKEM